MTRSARRTLELRPDAAAASPMPTWQLLAIICGTASLHLFLCFVNTSVTAVSDMHVAALEGLAIVVVFAISYRQMQHIHLFLLGGLTVYVLALGAIRVSFAMNGGIDIKPIRDLTIPVTFLLLGLQARNLRTADTVVRVLTALVVAVALFEYFFLDIFTQYFNIARYYISRGAMEAAQSMQTGDLFISGMRPQGTGGRNLLPFLGEHRVSSVFLEPVSLGNFGMILVVWALTRSKFKHKLYWGLILSGLTLIVLSDSRFGAYFCVIATALLFLPPAYVTVGLLFVPPLAVTGLLMLPDILAASGHGIDNTFIGRIMLSGGVLNQFNTATWLGFNISALPTFDSGYAYMISGIGVLGFAIAWYILLAMRGSEQFETFRNYAAAYYGVILCISNSPFTIKTASILWFMMGVLASATARTVPTSVSRTTHSRRAVHQVMPARRIM